LRAKKTGPAGFPRGCGLDREESIMAANEYSALRAKHQKEVDDFPFFFAFSNEQFAEGMREFGLNPETDTDEILAIQGTGGYMLKTDEAKFDEMFERHESERREAIAGDKDGDGYILQMFEYELANHECGYTGDIKPALDALGLTFEDIEADPRLKRGLEKAKKGLHDPLGGK
jgi:hypothetical protein